jgi:hypothetical protein
LVSIATVIGFLTVLYIGRDSRQAAANNRLSIWTILGNNLHIGGLIILLDPTPSGVVVESTISYAEVGQ